MTPLTIIRGPRTLSQPTPPSQRRRGGFIIVALAIVASCQALSVQAQNWINTSNAFSWYDRSANWSPSGAPGSNGTAFFGQQIPGAVYQVWWDAGTASVTPSAGFLDVHTDDVTFLNLDASPQHQFTINGSGGMGSITDFNIRNDGRLTIRGIHVRNLGGARVDGPNSSLTVDGSHPAGARMSVEGLGFFLSKGKVSVLAGGVLNSTKTVLHTGTAEVIGNGSQWNTGTELRVGSSLDGIPNFCSLRVFAGGMVTSGSGAIGRNAFDNGEVLVSGAGSQWNNAGGLVIGEHAQYASGALYISDGGLVTVGGTTTLGPNSYVQLAGPTSRLEFGETSFSEFEGIDGRGGSLAGNIGNAGYARVTDFTTSMSQNVNVEDVRVLNSGTLYGDGSIRFGLNNTASGEVDTVGNERMRFAGSGTNAGQINVFGGQVRFGQSFRNEDGGEVNNFGNSFVAGSIANDYGGIFSGRGQFVANGGWYNAGVMAFSDGTTDIVGDVYNSEGATIVTSGNGTTTFYDDFYQENAGTVRTSAGSSTVFFGEVSGAGSFVGAGTVFLEGDLRPGNSPGTMSFGGDLVLSSSASTTIELGGLGITDFDRLLIGGDLFLGGSSLEVALWDGFVLGTDMQFLFADVEGELFGQFGGLGEGSLVGNFGGTDLFITYNGFGGNGGVGLFTSAVPEPSALGLIGIASVLGLGWRRRHV
jgi:T5SS/PEP-CTERM-associated repeat protein